MMTSCCAILGLVSLVITNLCTIISIATPYWLERKTGIFMRVSSGLWADCNDEGCVWVFQDGYVDHSDEMWWIVAQALMAIGQAVCLLSLILATVALCCECKGCSSSVAVASFLVLAFLSMGGAVIVFGIFAHSDKNYLAKVFWNTRHPDSIFSWSFWLGIAAAGWSLLTSIIYFCEGCNRRS